MGTRYEKSRKNVSENRQTLDRLKDDKDALRREYTPLSEIAGIESLLDDEAAEAVQRVADVGHHESTRIMDETDKAEEAKGETAQEIQGEIDKLKSGLAKFERLKGFEFGKKAAVSGTDEYKRQISKFEELLGELGDATADGGGEVSNVSDGGYFFSEVSDTTTDFLDETSGQSAPVVEFSSNSASNAIMNKYPVISGPHSIEDDLTATNPNYIPDPESPWFNNCQRCVSAYEARRRGYDVEAQPLPASYDTLPMMRHPQGWPSVYEGAELIDCSANSGTSAAINIEDQMSSWGDGARAIVRVRWKAGGGHVFIAEQIRGQTHFMDPQNGTTDASSYFNDAQGSEVFCMRIDNLPFSERIHQCCSVREN